MGGGGGEDALSLIRKEEKSVTFATSGMEHLQMVHGHLQNFSFF